jgi:hypothetical protein
MPELIEGKHHMRITLRAAGKAVLVATSIGTLTLAGCSENPEQPSTGTDAADVRGPEDLEDVYDGPYTPDFHSDVEAYAGQEVTLEADVADVLSAGAFTITGPEGAEVEPLLVVTNRAVEDLAAGDLVTVAGTPQDEFEISAVEDELGVDLDDEAVEEWEGEPYLVASIIEPASAD